MTRRRRPPVFAPTRPWFQPWITAACPSGCTVNGLRPGAHDESNCLRVDHETPVYCTVTASPAFAGSPAPSTTSLTCNAFGLSQLGTVMSGLLLVSVLTLTSHGPPPTVSPDVHADRPV